MRDPEFQVANKILTGQLHRLRKAEMVKTKRHTAVSKFDLKKMFDYVCSKLDNPTMLQYNVYLDLAFYMGKLDKEGLHALTLDSFELNFTPEGRRYIRMTLKEECNDVIIDQPGNQ